MSNQEIHDRFSEFMDTLHLEPIQPLPLNDWVRRYPWRTQAAILKDHADMLLTGGLRARDKTVGAFTKVEYSKLTDPRNISSRTFAYQAVLGPYISAAEQLLSHEEWLVKHLTLSGRNSKLSKAHEEIAPTHYIECDFSRFDATVSQILLKQEHRVYHALFPDMDPIARECLLVQLNTSGFHLKGVHYATIGRRCSGDPNTSIGNAILNRFVHWLAWRHLPNWYSVHEGDDALAFIRGDVAVYRAALEAAAIALGFDIKIVVSSVLADTKFCGRCNYEVDGKIRSSCDFARTLPKFGMTTVLTQSKERDLRKGLLLAKALSYYQTDSHTPIIGPLCKTLINSLKVKPVHRKEASTAHRMEVGSGSLLSPPSDDDRQAFYHHTGLSPTDQLYYEEYHSRIFADADNIPAIVEKVPVPFSSEEFIQDTVKYFTVDPTGHGESLEYTNTYTSTHD